MTSRIQIPVTVLVLCLAASACTAPVARERPGPTVATLKKVAPRDLCVTEGRVHDRGGGQMQVDSAAMRAVVSGSSPEVAELRFVYEGPTDETSKLASGEIRRQAGLKLRAADSCNVVYVIWRFEPESRLVVSVKNNPGKHQHSECGDAGYRTVDASLSNPAPRLRPGDEHVLHAQITGSELRVLIDRELSWQGPIGADDTPGGPVGIRTDNARLTFELAAISGDSSAGACGAPAD